MGRSRFPYKSLVMNLQMDWCEICWSEWRGFLEIPPHISQIQNPCSRKPLTTAGAISYQTTHCGDITTTKKTFKEEELKTFPRHLSELIYAPIDECPYWVIMPSWGSTQERQARSRGGKARTGGNWLLGCRCATGECQLCVIFKAEAREEVYGYKKEATLAAT